MADTSSMGRYSSAVAESGYEEMSDFPESDFPPAGVDGTVVSPEDEQPEVDEARKAHRRLFTLGLLALILAIIAFFFPRCDFDDDERFGAGTGLTDEQLLALIEENCVIPGVPGPVGEDGSPGEVGSPGGSGVPGPAGEDGEPGTSGGQGPAGEQGEQGESGATGSPGPSGAQGEPGVCGPIGPAGPTGSAGAQGEAGPAGSQGDPGPAGPQGLQGVAGPTGPRGATGPVGPPGTGGLGGFGAFWDQCTQYSPDSGGALAMRFSHSESFNDSVRIAGANGATCLGVSPGSGGGSPIEFREPGIYNVQFSAQYTTLGGGGEAFIEVWIRKNGTEDIPWTNTHFYTVANSLRLVALINWFVPVACDGTWECDTYEIMWRPRPKNNVDPEELILVADSLADPEIPSIILTVNQVGG